MHSRRAYGSNPIPHVSYPSDGFDKPAAEYVHSLLRRKYAVLGMFFLIFGIFCVYALTRVSLYKSTAILGVALSLPSSGKAAFSDYFTNFALYYETVVQSLKTGKTPRRVTGKPGEDDPDDPVDVNPNRGTPLITLEMVADDPAVARQKLRAYLEKFIELHRKEVDDGTKEFLATMERDLRELELQMIQSQSELRDFSIRHGLVLSGSEPYFGSFLDKATDNLVRLKGLRLDLEIAANQRQRLLPSQMNDEYLRKLKNDCSSLKTEYTAMSSTYSSDFVTMKILKKKIDTFEHAINDIEGNVLSTNLSEARKREVSAREVYERTKHDLMHKSSLAMQFGILKKAAEADSSMYLALKDKLWHAKLYSSMIANSLEVYTPPSLPIASFYPNRLKIIGVGALLGLVGGIGLALVLDAADKRSRHIDSIKKRVNAPFLGMIPVSELASRSSREMNAFLEDDFPVSPFADALSIIHFDACQRVGAQSGTVICISSSLPSEGKTLISLALAKTVAAEDKKVLVIDGDMRKHGASDLFARPRGSAGLSDYLAKSTNLSEIIHESRLPGIRFISSGPTTENPVALLKTEAMADCIRDCRKNFDFIIIDTPPVLGMVDASILGARSDGVILVVKHGATSVDMVSQAVRSLSQAHVNVLGLVVNMVREQTGSSQQYYASSYYADSRNISSQKEHTARMSQ
ncbi:MAG TPA: polysaccharide biosynthesis tyrosine autokinase [Desulfomonilaceae bacterium]|nr:polysaccharide biosynthesis tyrosine autokinase [Desulfomonilaceae bacterium]